MGFNIEWDNGENGGVVGFGNDVVLYASSFPDSGSRVL